MIIKTSHANSQLEDLQVHSILKGVASVRENSSHIFGGLE